MPANIPQSLQKTMDERYLYEAMQKGGYILNLPKYDEESFYFSEKCVHEVAHMPLSLQSDIIWTVIADAHNEWRSQPEIIKMILDEDCSNCLNVFLESELAGPEIFEIWANKFINRFNLAGFDFGQTLEINGYDNQKSWMHDICFMLPEVMREIFLVNRRRFVEVEDPDAAGRAPIVGKRDLYEYLTNTRHDVLGVCSWREDGQEISIIKGTIRRALYQDSNMGLDFRLTRQTILANGGGAPIEW